MDLKNLVSRLEAGQQIVVSDETYDSLVDYLDQIDHPFANKLASLFNPNQVGTKDVLLAFFKNINVGGR